MTEITISDDTVRDSNDSPVENVDDKSPYTNLSPREKENKFLNLVKMCEVSSVRSLLKNNDFDLNCKNYQGMMALNLAIESNCEQMVDLLLSQPGLDFGDSLMHAIRANQYSIVIKLLDTLQSVSPESIDLGYESSTKIPHHITPLMLAVQYGHFRIISLLLQRGHVIPMPDKPQCLCHEVIFG